MLRLSQPLTHVAPGETALITLHLYGAISAATSRKLKAALAAAPVTRLDHRRTQKAFFVKFDAMLDLVASVTSRTRKWPRC